MIHQLDPLDPGGGYGGGGAGGGVGTPPPAGTTNLSTVKWFDINWTFEEAEPFGLLTGFEVAVFTGADPDTGILARSLITVDDPTVRRWVDTLELRVQVDLKATVRAVYGTRGKSAWAPASAVAAFIPDNVTLAQGQAASYRKLSDGTIMQFLVGPQTTVETNVLVDWAIPFPNACLQVQVTAQNVNGTLLTDTWYQVVSYNQSGAVLFRQSSNGDSGPTRPHVLAVGY